MRLSLRFVIPLLVALAAFAYAVVPLVDQLTLKWFSRDLDIRANLVASAVEEPVQDLIRAGNRRRILQFFTRITQDERLLAVGFCPLDGSDPIATPTFPKEVTCATLDRFASPNGGLLQTEKGPVNVSVRPLAAAAAEGADSQPRLAANLGRLVLIHDMSFIARRSAETREYLFLFFVGLGLTVAVITVVIAQLSWRGWVQGLRGLLRGERLFMPADPRAERRVSVPPAELRPIATDLRALIEDLEADHRSRDEDQLVWTPDTLRQILDRELRGQEVIVVSNREPYIHVRHGPEIEVRRPASGLVTALEPIMRACSGTWIAHGGGNGDREVVDKHDRVAVPPPPDAPAYQLRRVWLTEEEEQGYYYGFSNEGIWPLCHIAHVRPIFRTGDWEQYVKVNRKFANTVQQEAQSADPIVLVQDYHLALLPRMIREQMPDATIISFWHIPWPNPEAFAICPWREELLDGMLGSTILGFHTQFHVNNFVDTVDRLLEARVDRELFAVTYRGKPTTVRRYPISVEWPPEPELLSTPVEQCRTEIRRRHDLPPDHAVGIGVERLDYTKGIEERLRAVERLLELEPRWIGRFSFVQIAAPSRTRIDEYRAYEMRVRDLATRINQRFPEAAQPPIILKVEHHQPDQIFEYFRGADVCLVTSLHDGMNLVAKEFVSSRDDERGVLILSLFTGAARELPEALIVNPYDTDQCAAALQLALRMSSAEQRTRMRLMRGLIQDFNVYRWAGRMLMDAAAMRRRGRLPDVVKFPPGTRRKGAAAEPSGRR
ncbi:MAG TPA: trehalose-6-phosphate synthase [Gemmatimonadales bacterium]|nr:trehalose-6-phosphate synthase [Gemmatimonadales bacterium]